MKIIVELNSPEELQRFLETMGPKAQAAAPKQQDQKPEGPPTAPAPVTQVPAPAQTAAPKQQAPSFDTVTKAAIQKMDAGKQTELRALLQKHGAQSLPELKDKPDKLAAFYADLEVL